MRNQFKSFLLRWVLNTLGLWLAVSLFGTGNNGEPDRLIIFIFAGLVFSVVNALLKSILVVLSLPALLLTLGLFMLIVNGILVYISIKIAPGFSMTFWHSVLTGIVISLVNYIVSSFIDIRQVSVKKEGENHT